MPRFHVIAELSDAPDGLSRLMLDVARFGLDLHWITLETAPRGTAQTEMQIGTASTVDRVSVMWRFSRHPVVSALTINPVPDRQEG